MSQVASWFQVVADFRRAVEERSVTSSPTRPKSAINRIFCLFVRVVYERWSDLRWVVWPAAGHICHGYGVGCTVVICKNKIFSMLNYFKIQRFFKLSCFLKTRVFFGEYRTCCESREIRAGARIWQG